MSHTVYWGFLFENFSSTLALVGKEYSEGR